MSGKPLKNIKRVVGCVEETRQLARAKSDTGGRGREGIGIGCCRIIVWDGVQLELVDLSPGKRWWSL